MSECVIHDVRAAEPICFVGGCVMVPMVEAVKQSQIATRLIRLAQVAASQQTGRRA